LSRTLHLTSPNFTKLHPSHIVRPFIICPRLALGRARSTPSNLACSISVALAINRCFLSQPSHAARATIAFFILHEAYKITLQLPHYPLRMSETSQQRLPLNGQQLHLRRDWICCDKADPATIASITRGLWNRRIFCVVSSPKSIRASAGAPV
jgi:hypothetical protein